MNSTDPMNRTEPMNSPVRFPTSRAFGGEGRRELFVTSESRSIAPPERPREVARGAGALFRLGTEVPGLPATRMVL